MEVPRIRIIVVTGYPRSGTTLLARVLGQAMHGVAIGELFDSIQTSPGSLLCACGHKFLGCEFWNPVINATFGEWDEVYSNEFRRLAQSVARAKHLPQLVFSQTRSPEYRARSKELFLILEKLYTNIQNVSGCPVLVESSKSPVFPFLLMRIFTLDVRVVQLIRDSRGVVYSVSKRSNQPVTDQNPLKTNIASVAREWTAHNLVFELERMLAKNWLCVHYERFASEPLNVVKEILTRLGETDPDLSYFTGTNTIKLQRNHIIGANRNRFDVGDRYVRLDDEWQTKMSRREKSLITFITLPVLLWHRYPLIVPDRI